MTGAQIAEELRKRKGHKPSPGTIYPALKDLRTKGLITADDDKRYSLTPTGEAELETSIQTFFDTFWDIDEMRACCCESHDHGPAYHRRRHGQDCCGDDN